MVTATELREHLVARGLAPRSVYQYLRTVEHIERWCSGHGHHLDTLTAVELAAYVETVPRTWATRNLLRASLTHYWRASGRTDAPLAAVRVPTKPRMVCRALDDTDAAILAKAARSRGDAKGLAVVLGLYQGLRREEIARLGWAAAGPKLLTIVGKGDRERRVPLHPVTVELLGAHPLRGPYIFPGRFGDHVSPTTIWAWSREVADDAGVGLVTPHVLRHIALASANDATGDLRSVQDFAGHSRPETTAGYTRVSAIRLEAVVMSLTYGA